MEPENTPDINEPERHERARVVAQELRALRRLSAKLHQHAANGDPSSLRDIILQRDALIKSVRANGVLPNMAASDDFAPAFSDEDRSLIRKAIAAINTLDTKTECILKERTARIGEELMKLRAGRKYRATSRRLA